MSDFDLLVRGGTVVTATDTFAADIGIIDGRIHTLSTGLRSAKREIDATGKLVLPGGIDSHCHIDQQSLFGFETADDFYSGTLSAACGGTTTIIPFAAQLKGQSIREVVEDYHRRAEGKAVIDYAFHLIVSDPTPQVLGQELPALIQDGYTSFKIFLTYDVLKLEDRKFLEVLAVARREGAMVMVHAENNDAIKYLSDLLIQAGHTEPKFHEVSRPMPVEREATHRAITFAELIDLPILIVHVSGAEAIEQIQWARNRGLRVYAETCPQYLFLTSEDTNQPGMEGAKYMCSPPPRDKANQEKVWEALERGVFEVVSSDHSPYRFNHPKGKLMHGPKAPFTKISNGVPGIEVRQALLFSGGVGTGRLTLNQFVALASTNAAKLYGLHPRKGTIAVGSDADLAIWDPEREVTIRHELLHDNVDYTPYEGMTVCGWPVVTISRGEVVCEDGEPKAERGRGAFLPCDKPSPARPKGRQVTPFNPVTGTLAAGN